MILQSTIDQLDKEKVYCKACLQNNIIAELIWNEDLEKFNSCQIHNKNTNSYIVKFNIELNKWCTYRGKGLNSKFQGIIETDKDIQEKYLNCKFVYFNIELLDKSVNIEINSKGKFFISKFLDRIEYIHANSKDPFIIYRVDLYSYCDFEDCKKKFYFKELSYSLQENGKHFCCANHSLQYRNRTDKMRNISSNKMTKWYQTEEEKAFIKKHYTELGNSDIAKENLIKGREKAKETWQGSNRQKEHLQKINAKNNRNPELIKKKAETKKNNQAIKEGFKKYKEKEEYIEKENEEFINKIKSYGYNSIKDYYKDLRIAKRMKLNNILEYKQYLKEKEIKQKEENKKIEELLIKYNCKDYLSYANKLKSIKRLGFNSIEEYEIFKEIKENNRLKEKESRLNLAKSYGYNNYKSYSVEVGHATSHGFDTLEEYREWKLSNNYNKNIDHIILNEKEYELFQKLLKEIVIFDEKFKNFNKISGVYCIIIDNYPFYIRESLNILTSFLYHAKVMIKYNEYFDNFLNDILNNKNRTIKLIILD